MVCIGHDQIPSISPILPDDCRETPVGLPCPINLMLHVHLTMSDSVVDILQSQTVWIKKVLLYNTIREEHIPVRASTACMLLIVVKLSICACN